MTDGKHTPCVEWTGYLDRQGYGRVQHNGKWRGAHRVAWEAEQSPIPAGMVIDHLCRNPSCVNTEHMEVVTPRENTLRGVNPFAVNARKTTCDEGHRLEGENLSIDWRGYRQCKTCRRARWRAYRLRNLGKETWTRS